MFIKRSALEPEFFEVWDGDCLVEEIAVPFRIRKFPKSFESLEKVKRWIKETEEKLARFWAYRIISMKSYPSAVVTKKLRQKRFSDVVVEKMVSELKSAGYLQDDEWIDQEVLREFRKGRGPRYIEMKLRSKGVSSEKVRLLISPQMQKEKIRLSLKLPREKAMRQLQRNGFDLDLILEIFS